MRLIYRNYVFDDLSDQFNGVDNEFTLKSSGSNISGIYNEGAIVLVNDILQTPGELNNYTLDEIFWYNNNYFCWNC